MGAIQVKNVPAELHEALRRRATAEGMDLQGYVLQVLRRDLAVPSQREWLETLHSQPSVADLPPAAEILDEQRRRRQHDLDHRVDRH
ncbi:MAG: hypothetical protein H0W01_16400 [Pseudonocardiales bacterium]|nr:hypothetical protein [Pseudonocardiales bacterium]